MKFKKATMKRILNLLTSAMLIFTILTAGCSNHKNKKKIVVLTFDDAVQSQVDFVAPFLKEKGFGATFFITAAGMNTDTAGLFRDHRL